jgi:RimJ/RimL family protein N-acetyltransferase
MLAGPAYRIVTDRLILRCYDPRDAPALKAAVDASLDHLAEMPWSRDEPQTLDEKIALLRAFRGRFDLGQDFVYGIFDRDDTTVLGGSGLHRRVGDQALEIGYWIRAAHINRGLATEAAGALTRVGFEIERLARIEIHCGPRNLRSAAVARKLGYTHEATLRERAIDASGNPRDAMIWTLFAADYPGSPCARRNLEAFDAAGRRIL